MPPNRLDNDGCVGAQVTSSNLLNFSLLNFPQFPLFSICNAFKSTGFKFRLALLPAFVGILSSRRRRKRSGSFLHFQNADLEVKEDSGTNKLRDATRKSRWFSNSNLGSRMSLPRFFHLSPASKLGDAYLSVFEVWMHQITCHKRISRARQTKTVVTCLLREREFGSKTSPGLWWSTFPSW